ncbi:MAG: HAMP domain-containing protein [Candidatus Riflebacteria bacterium]|nr:HAMP domain-containing protein [Candidatus Riflebacteria bacterium]
MAVSTNAREEFDLELILSALMEIKRGNFAIRLPDTWIGLSGKIADTFNSIAELNQNTARELEKIGRTAGKEGKFELRVQLPGVAGAWAEQIESVNILISDLTAPMTEISRIIDAVAQGDLSQKMPMAVDGRPLQGAFLRSAETVNTTVVQLNSLASEVTRVSREVGTDGKLGGQAEVKGVFGVWKELTDSVNVMATNLTNQVRNIAAVTTAVANGDLSRKIGVEAQGEILELKNTINTMVDQLGRFAAEVMRVSREVGTDGQLGGQAMVLGVGGTWKELTDSVNHMASNLTSQVRNISQVTTAVANGDLSKKITVDAKNEILELKNTINALVDQLSLLSSEVIRVAREVGSEGILGGQAVVHGVGGTWKDLTDNVNMMASNLTDQVRGIAKVVTAVANGSLKQRLTVQAKGEIATLAETINSMTDTLAVFADQVSGVAREVGVEGKLGGQANVPGAAGTWLDLTNNVNQLAGNLTSQVRAISEVTQAVIKGDLTRTVRVEAEGELATLKDIINEMIRNLRERTQKNTEQDWLKTTLGSFTRMLQGQKDLVTVAKMLLSELGKVVNAKHGLFFSMETSEDSQKLKMIAGFAFRERKNLSTEYAIGEGLVGQCAYEKERILITNVPDDYIQIHSGLGEAKPFNIVVLPVLFEAQVKAVIELASFERFTQTQLDFLEQLAEILGIVLNTIEADMRTEELLKQSQKMSQELKSQQEKLQQTNDELGEKARLLVDQNAEVEAKNKEVEQARLALEDKAAQLALTSKYKSEFLANMSHELRTPLNSLLILSQNLAENTEKNLTQKQVEYADTINSSGNDLLSLINEILDLSKIESGTASVDATEVFFDEIHDFAEKNFRHVAEKKGVEYLIERGPHLPQFIVTDLKRVQQIIKNLLSNSFKFTAKGSIRFRMEVATEGWSRERLCLSTANQVIGFSVSDTGIGIPADKLQLVFEAFQQADGTTARRYGGTGLGLSISREIVRLLGGEIKVASKVGEGSLFTFYLPNNLEKEVTAIGSGNDLQDESGKNTLPPKILNSVAGHNIRRQPSRTVGREALINAFAEGDSFAKKSSRNSVSDFVLSGKTVLIVDDDVRNIFALTGFLEKHGMKLFSAENGKEACEIVKNSSQIDLVLMDIMMPEMDGYATIREIRGIEKLKDLPIIALTAKAMKGDREKCIEAGASDYIAKPVNTDQLLSMMRAWLSR